MKNHMNKKKQRGATLVVGMLLLTVAMIVSLSSMRGGTMQERMTSNQNNKAISHMAAEAGASWFIKQIADMLNTATTPVTPEDLEEWAEELANNVTGSSVGSSGFFNFDFDTPPFLFSGGQEHITVIGQSRSGSEVLAETQITLIYNLLGSSGRGGGLGGAINFFGDVGNFQAPNSNSFEVDGNGGPAIGVNSSADATQIQNAIESAGRSNNYHGGVEEMTFPSPWNNAANLQSFIEAIETTALTSGHRHYTSSHDAGNDNWGDDKVNYVQGDLSVSGNFSGSGVLVVEGNFTTQGTPSWDGVIIVLGGTFSIGGGGNGGLNGSIYIADIDKSESEWSFDQDGSLTWSNGGGNATYSYDCDQLTAARNLLNTTAKSFWEMDENCNNTGGGGSGSLNTITGIRFNSLHEKI